MKPKIKSKRTFFVSALLVGLILFLIISWKSNPVSIIKTLKSFTLWHFIVIICTFLLQLLFSTISIGLIIRKLNHRVALRRLFPLQLIRFGVSYVTPFSNNGGEPLQIYLLKRRHNVPISCGTAAIILEAILRLSVSLAIMASGSFTLFISIKSLILKIILLLLFLFFAFLITLFFYSTIKRKGCLTVLGRCFGFNKFQFYQRKTKIIRNIDRCTIYFFHRYPKDFILTICLAILAMSCYVVRFHLILLFLGYGASVLESILVFSITQVLILAPIPTMLGIHEAGQGLLSLITSIPIQTGISFVIILRIISLFMTIPGLTLLGHASLNGLGKKLRDKIFFTLNNKKNRT